MLFHNVYFWLKPELTPAQRAEFRREVEKLAGIKAVEKVTVGAPAGTTRRPVIDSSYDVALIVQCKDVAAEAAYQIDPAPPRLRGKEQALLDESSDLRLRVRRGKS